MLSRIPNEAPLTRLTPWYPGLLGIRGSDAPLGIRHSTQGIVLYVDSGHPARNDQNYGTNPVAPLATVQAAVNSPYLTPYSIIKVCGSVAESVVIANSRPVNCVIMGIGNEEWGPTWTSGAAAENALTIRRPGWTIVNIRFNPPAAAAAIRLEHDGATIFSDRTVITGCDFDGLWTGLYGIRSVGQPDQVKIINNRFHELDGAGNTAAAIYLDLTPWALPYMWTVQGNEFRENDRHIAQIADHVRGGYNWIIKDNVFADGEINTTVTFIDMRGGPGGGNILVGNFFGGDYSHTGGYWEHALNPGSWVGNIAEDVDEPEVGDNGFTIAVPAA